MNPTGWLSARQPTEDERRKADSDKTTRLRINELEADMETLKEKIRRSFDFNERREWEERVRQIETQLHLLRLQVHEPSK